MTNAGLYIHIPFCKKACHYCNFHFSTQLKYKEEMLNCILLEIEQRAKNHKSYHIQSIYFGGGTPSILEESEILQLLQKIHTELNISENAEITLEANPDDLDLKKLKALYSAGINRLSIGIQSFFDSHLEWMNRSHNSYQAINSIQDARQIGFEEINADLIFALPRMDMQQWISNIQSFIDLDLTHWSCYNLTIEPKTALHHQVTKKGLMAVSQDEAAIQYQTLLQMAQGAGMEHYEISNFCKPGKFAIHNSNYWKGVPYLGVGPSAHSFDGTKRSWNIANNALYMRTVSQGGSYASEEILSDATKYNEYIMTGLRTKWGCNVQKIETHGTNFKAHFLSEVQPFIAKGWMQCDTDIYTLTNTGKLFADHISSELFWVD